MKIISLVAENVKKLVAVEIRPDGNLAAITGKNGQGKSSTAPGGSASCWKTAGLYARYGSAWRSEANKLLIKVSRPKLTAFFSTTRS